MDIVYKYSQLENDNRLSYKKSLQICDDNNIHLGQLKLFFSELLFITICYEKIKEHIGNKKIKILYAGAAPGYHTTLLAELFPNFAFDLWGPRDFETEERDNIFLYQEYFTNDVASSYKESDEIIFFMSDIRTESMGKFKREKNYDRMDQIVINDMQLQLNWCKIISPKFSYLKFRLPYFIKQTDYLDGTIFLQPYNKISTEARLLTDDYHKKITYDNVIFEEKMAWHNAYNRCESKKYDTFIEILATNNLKNNWDNNYALYITLYYLKIFEKEKSNESLSKLFMRIINFHIKKFGKKYDVLFI